MRDLNADLALCEAVTEVFYDEGGGYTASGGLYEKETEFFEQAPHGWPEAIRRAIAAEAEVKRVKESRRLLYLVHDEECARSSEYYNQILTLREENAELRDRVMGVFQKARNDCAVWDGKQSVGLPVFQDRVYARRLVKDLQPILFPVQDE